MTTSKNAALWILGEAKKMGLSVCPMKLQKLLYYCQGYSIGMKSEPLFDENIEAWAHGPVVPSVYRSYKKHGVSSINFFQASEPPQEVADLIVMVLRDKGNLTPSELRNATHEELPYKNTAKGEVIDNELMDTYFSPMFWAGDEEDAYQPSFDTVEEEKQYFKSNFRKEFYDAIFAKRG